MGLFKIYRVAQNIWGCSKYIHLSYCCALFEYLQNIPISDSIFVQARLAGALKQFLFFARGSEWRRTRNIMTPAFSSGKLKLVCILYL